MKCWNDFYLNTYATKLQTFKLFFYVSRQAFYKNNNRTVFVSPTIIGSEFLIFNFVTFKA